MRAWGYVAYTESGKRRSGTVVSETEAIAASTLRGRGLYVSELTDKGARTTSKGRFGKSRLGPDTLAVFTRQMAVLLSADLPADAALDAVRTSGAGSAMDTFAARAHASLLEGQTLSDALDGAGAGLPLYYLAALRAGERAGDLGAVFTELANYLEQSGNERAEIASALVYPGFVAAVSLLVCGILMTTVAPQIVEMFSISGRPLPDITRVVLGVSGWIERNFVVVLGLIGGLVALGIASSIVPNLRNARDRLALRLPLVGRLMRAQASVQYLRTLALVLGSRHAVLAGAESAAEVLSVQRFRKEGSDVCAAIRRGESLSQSMTGLSFVPAVARQLVEAGEMSARLSRMTERAAVLVENSLRAERKRIAALIEPILMMLVGGLVLMIVLAVLLPIFDLQSLVAG